MARIEDILDNLDEIVVRFYLSVILFMGILVYQFLIHMDGSGLFLFLLLPLYIVSFIASITCLWSFRKIRFHAFIPLAINIGSLFLPSAREKVEYYYYRPEREAIVQRICNDTTYESMAYNRINSSDSKISDMSIDVEVHSGNRYVMFYTYQPALALSSSYRGYLYVQKGGNPSVFMGLSDSKRATIQQLDENWYKVSYN